MPCLNSPTMRFAIFGYKENGIDIQDLNKEIEIKLDDALKRWGDLGYGRQSISTRMILMEFLFQIFGMKIVSGHAITQLDYGTYDRLQIFWRDPVWLLQRIC